MITEENRYRVYSIVEPENEPPFWLNMGMAFPHKDGKGFNILLQALPLQGRLTLRSVGDRLGGAEGLGTSDIQPGSDEDN